MENSTAIFPGRLETLCCLVNAPTAYPIQSNPHLLKHFSNIISRPKPVQQDLYRRLFADVSFYKQRVIPSLCHATEYNLTIFKFRMQLQVDIYKVFCWSCTVILNVYTNYGIIYCPASHELRVKYKEYEL